MSWQCDGCGWLHPGRPHDPNGVPRPCARCERPAQMVQEPQIVISQCEICGETRRPHPLKRYTTSHKYVCGMCVERHGGQCSRCGQHHLPLGARGNHNHPEVHRGHRGERRQCPTCAGGAVITQWNYRGRITKFGDGDLFYGVENENEFKTQNSVNAFRRYYADKMDRCWLVHDGTLNRGVEVSFQPMTYDYWMGETGDDLVMDTRRRVDSSYELQGTHVHMSKDAFTTRHLYRFINFLTVNLPLLSYVAGRDVGSKRAFWNGEFVALLAASKKSHDKYKFINLKPENTVEIRLFKGAFHINTVRMYIQFLDSVYHYTKNVPAKDANVIDYITFLQDRKEQYGIIAKYLGTKTDFTTLSNHPSVSLEVDEDRLPNDDAGMPVQESTVGAVDLSMLLGNTRYTAVEDEFEPDIQVSPEPVPVVSHMGTSQTTYITPTQAWYTSTSFTDLFEEQPEGE